MSTLFWKLLRLTPALLGASILFAGSAYARESASENTATRSSEMTVIPATQLPDFQATVSNTSAPETLVEQPTSQASPSLVSRSPSDSPQLLENPIADTSGSVFQRSEPSANVNRTDDHVLAQQMPEAGNTNTNSSEMLEQIQQYQDPNTSTGESTLDQVTNVNQLSDVRPTDWAYEALRSLVERYGCIAGYPDGTFRGNRAMTRYEFAAGVNACLQQIERLISSTTEGFVTKQDLETLQRLVDEFRTELTALGGRVDKLEGRVGFLEDNQFSTTTKLRGEVIFNVADLFGEQDAAGNDYAADETVAQYRARLNFDTSFTGRDLLRTRLQAGNISEFGPLRSGLGIPGTNITREGRFGYQLDTGGNVEIDRLYYRFPVGNIAQVYLGANALQYEDFVEVLNPNFESSGTGALSRFGRFSPIYRVGANGVGVGVSIGQRGPLRVDLGYLTDEGNDPGDEAGLFNGNYSALAQVTFQPARAFRIAATYAHAYDNSRTVTVGDDTFIVGGRLRHGTGSIASQISVARPVVSNSYGVEASFAFSPQLILSGWGMYTDAIVLGRGNADVWSYGATLAINDIGTQGSTLGFVVGMEPKLTGADASVGALLPGGRRRDVDTGLHLEGFYKFRISPNITLTPGVIWLTSPGHNNDNDDIFIGAIRTTFTF
jgi:hypothetical protein